uniref:Uncharacterized protein n=1 Tax=Peronospora matthiolae TaxID=2874970 RepID=A0AAV1U1B6_9STRA
MTTRSLTLAGLLAAARASAHMSVFVQHDAMYLLPASRGLPCSNDGGTSCPKAGDIASAGCQPYLLSYNGLVCVAPVDAQCVEVVDDTWACTFPQTASTSVNEANTIAAYSDDDGDDDEALSKVLRVLCDVTSGKGTYQTTAYDCERIASATAYPSNYAAAKDSGGFSADEVYPADIDDLIEDVDSIDETYPTHHVNDGFQPYIPSIRPDAYDLKGGLPLVDPIQMIPDAFTGVPDSYLTVIPDILTRIPDVLTVVPDILTRIPDVLTAIPDILPVIPDIPIPTVVTDIVPVVSDILTAAPDIFTLAPTIPVIPIVAPAPLAPITFPRFPRRMRSLSE